MTAKELEQGNQLTIHNATKEQLKWLYKDKESQAHSLYEELQEANKKYNNLFQENLRAIKGLGKKIIPFENIYLFLLATFFLDRQ